MDKKVTTVVRCGDNITELFSLPCVQQIKKLREGNGYIIYLTTNPGKSVDLDAFRGNCIVGFDDGTWGVLEDV